MAMWKAIVAAFEIWPGRVDLGTWPGRAVLFAIVLFGISLVVLIGDFGNTFGFGDRWIWFGFGMGFGYSAILAGLIVFSGWFFAHLAPPTGVALTRARALLIRTVALIEMLVFIAYAYIGMYYCITYLQGWSPDTRTVIHREIFSDRPYAAAYMAGFVIMLPVLFWSFVWTDGQWGEQIRGIWKDRPM